MMAHRILSFANPVLFGLALWAALGAFLTAKIMRMTEPEESYTPGSDRCPECGSVVKIADPNGYKDRDFVQCGDCDWRSDGGDVNWSQYEPPSRS